MIPANGAQYVSYTTDKGLPGPVRQVLAWDEDGHPMVLGNVGLVRAANLGSVDRVRQDAPAIVGSVAGGGWLIDCQDDQGNKWTTPVLAWTVHADGSATPISTDREGVTSDATEGLSKYRIHHPDESHTPHKEPVGTCDPDCRDCFGTSWVDVPDGEWDTTKHTKAPVRRCRCYKTPQGV
ncbi:hypothetical protein ACIOFV_50160 [Streptomyces mirabilis]|uniref:hypothetical protein n=1 Tax=Streptomyces mirabilis TaxID=68239 RepID=UPI0038012E80